MSRVETQTNQLFRKKYYISAETVIAGNEDADEVEDISSHTTTPVIDASRVILSPEPVTVRHGVVRETDKIQVDVIKEGPLAKLIRIACPCGRRTELAVQYESPS